MILGVPKKMEPLLDELLAGKKNNNVLDSWPFPFSPRCKPGDKLTFLRGSKPVASAVICAINRTPNKKWKILWKRETFRVL